VMILHLLQDRRPRSSTNNHGIKFTRCSRGCCSLVVVVVVVVVTSYYIYRAVVHFCAIVTFVVLLTDDTSASTARCNSSSSSSNRAVVTFPIISLSIFSFSHEPILVRVPLMMMLLLL